MKSSGSPRRAFLRRALGAATVAAAGGYSARAAYASTTLSSAVEPGDMLAELPTVPFYGLHQPGILPKPQLQVAVISFDVTAGKRAELTSLMQAITSRVALLSAGGTPPPPSVTGPPSVSPLIKQKTRPPMSEPASHGHPDAESPEFERAELDESGADEVAVQGPIADEAAATTQRLPAATDARPTSAVRLSSGAVRGLSVALVAAAFVGAGIAYVAFANPPGTADAASSKPSATISGPVPSAQQTLAVQVSSPSAVAPQSSGPTALRPSNPSVVKAWNAGAGAKALQQVTAVSGSALMAGTRKQYGEMLQYCEELSSAVETAQQAAPIQDTSMQKEYAAALSSLKQGTVHCVSGISQVSAGVEDTTININHTELGAAVSDLNTGINDLYVATEALRTQ